MIQQKISKLRIAAHFHSLLFVLLGIGPVVCHSDLSRYWKEIITPLIIFVLLQVEHLLWPYSSYELS